MPLDISVVIFFAHAYADFFTSGHYSVLRCLMLPLIMMPYFGSMSAIKVAV